jgi:hypothetical protein
VTRDDVESRIVEAAEIERRMPNSGEKPKGYGGAWPAFMYTFADRVGWDDVRRKEDEAARTMIRATVSRAEYDRWQEVRGWIVEVLTDPRERRAVSAWAIACAGGRPFAKWCRMERIARQTGYRRVDRAVEKIVLCQNGLSVQPKAMDEVLQAGRVSAIDEGTMGQATPRHWMAEDAFPSDNPETRDIGPGSWSADQADRRKRTRAKPDT